MADHRKTAAANKFSFGLVLPGLKKAVKNLSTGGHTELGNVLFDQKVVIHNHNKTVLSKLQDADNLLKWSQNDDNIELRSLFFKFAELEQLSAQVHQQYTVQLDSYRRTYKQVLKVERTLDELSKVCESNRVKVDKLSKVHSQTKKPSEHQLQEIDKALSTSEDSVAALAVKTEQVSIFKHAKVRCAVLNLLEAEQALHEKSLDIISAKKRLLSTLLPKDIPRKANIDAKELVECGKLVSDVAALLNLSRPIITDPATPSPTHENSGFLKGFLRNNWKNQNKKKVKKHDEVFNKQAALKILSDWPPVKTTGAESDDNDEHDYTEPFSHLKPTPLPRSAVCKSVSAVAGRSAPKPLPRPARSLGDLTETKHYDGARVKRSTQSVCISEEVYQGNDYLDVLPQEVNDDEDSSSEDDEEYMHLFDIIPPKNHNDTYATPTGVTNNI